MARISHLARGNRGQSLVELALVLPLVLLPIFAGLTDVGRALNAYIIITNAAREGARYGAGNPATCEIIQDRAEDEAIEAGGLSRDNIGIEILCNDSGTCPCASGDALKVRVTYELELIFKTILEPILGSTSIEVSASVTMIAF